MAFTPYQTAANSASSASAGVGGGLPVAAPATTVPAAIPQGFTPYNVNGETAQAPQASLPKPKFGIVNKPNLATPDSSAALIAPAATLGNAIVPIVRDAVGDVGSNKVTKAAITANPTGADPIEKSALPANEQYTPNEERSNAQTPEQQIGDAATSALNLATIGTGVGAIADVGGELTAEQIAEQAAKTAAEKAAPLSTRIATGAANLAAHTAESAAAGYGYDVAGNISDNKQGAAIAKPGAGTIIGALAPVGLEAAGGLLKAGSAGVDALKNVTRIGQTPEDITTATRGEIQKVVDGNAPLRRSVAAAVSRGNDPVGMLAEVNPLKGSIDNTGTIHTIGEDGVAEQFYNEHIKPVEATVSKNLEIENKSIPIAKVKASMLAAVDGNFEGESLVTAQNKVEREIDGLEQRADKDGNIQLSKLQDAKINKTSNLDYTNPTSKATDKTIANVYKTLIENNSESIDVKAVNADLAKRYSTLDLIEKLDGKKVEGGRLGKLVARGVGSTVGAIAGAAGGPVGSAAAGYVGGEIASRVQGALMASGFSREAQGVIENSPELQKALQNIEDAKNATQKAAYQAKLSAMLQAKNVSTIDSPGLYEPYTPDDKLPVIDAGKTPKPKVSTLPIVGEADLPKVFSPEKPVKLPGSKDIPSLKKDDSSSKNQSSLESSAPIKNPIAPKKSIANSDISSSTAPNKKEVKLPTGKSVRNSISSVTGKSAGLPKNPELAQTTFNLLKNQYPDISDTDLKDIAQRAQKVFEAGGSKTTYINNAIAKLRKAAS